jgi:hypothetical protein
MTPARAAAQETRKAASWADATAIRLLNAGAALKAAILKLDGCEIAQVRHECDVLRSMLDTAIEDVTGWRKLSRKIR